LLLRRARLADGRVADVRVEGERIADVQAIITAAPADRVVDLGGELLLLPAPAEPHAHLDKAFLAERIPNERGDLAGAIEAVMSNRHVFSVGDIAERAERAAVTLLANGATAIRTHADVMRGHGLRSVEGLVRARERLAGRVELQIVALMGWPVTGADGAEHRTMLREAIAAGADVVGGCPHLEPEPEAATDTLLTIAAELGCPIDLHTDEQLRPDVLCVRDFAARVTTTGFADGAVASHCVSLSVQPPAVQAEVAGEVAAAGIAVVTLPQTNLYLQGRDHAVATPRGLTALRPLLDAGVTVAGGADNLQDPFNPIGRADPLETAALLVLAGHLSPDEAYHAVSASARAAMGLPAVTVTPGAPAELMALPASSIREAIAFAPAPRLVVHRGIVVVEPSTGSRNTK
jgi:cytosine/creatinine deaminase